MSEARKVLVASNPLEAAHLAAELFVAAADVAIASRGRCFVALCGGSGPRPLYNLLASPPWSERVLWEKVHVFWGDERFVTPDHANSNHAMARDLLLSKVDIPPSNIHRVMTETGSPEEVAAQYEATIRAIVPSTNAIPTFDINVMGLGTNGHTASLFPNRPTLHVTDRLVVSDYIEELSSSRITMTVPVFNESSLIIFIVTGADKSDVVHDVLLGPHDPERLPAQLICPRRGALVWIFDDAAAARLPKS